VSAGVRVDPEPLGVDGDEIGTTHREQVSETVVVPPLVGCTRDEPRRSIVGEDHPVDL